MNRLFILLATLLFMVIIGCGGGSSEPALLSSAKAITAFSLDGTAGTIDEEGKTIAITKPFGTVVTALVATFTTTGASVKVGATIQVSGKTTNDFTSHVDYTITAVDSTSVIYTVSVTIAAPARLPKTGQTACYDADGNGISCTGTGQDGDLQKGVVWPIPRFTNNNDQTITDNLTGLMWTQNGNAPGPDVCTPGVTKNWQQGMDYAACLNTNNYLGHNDWRLPNMIELRSLVHYELADTSAWLNTQGFTNVDSSGYWSSNYSPIAPGYHALIVFLSDGQTSADYRRSAYHVWAVRDGQSGIIKLWFC